MDASEGQCFLQKRLSAFDCCSPDCMQNVRFIFPACCLLPPCFTILHSSQSVQCLCVCASCVWLCLNPCGRVHYVLAFVWLWITFSISIYIVHVMFVLRLLLVSMGTDARWMGEWNVAKWKWTCSCSELKAKIDLFYIYNVQNLLRMLRKHG